MSCNLCPRCCNVDRKTQKGFCGVNELAIARISLHEWEEPCISGTKGSGTIFFSGCNLRCKFCQNDEISRSDHGRIISTDTLGKIMLYQQDSGAENINFVSPTQYGDLIAESLQKYKSKLKIPILYNSNGYESLEQLKKLDGLIDIYLPDLKYSDNKLAIEYSSAPNYFEIATACIAEMKRQQKKNVFVNGMLKRGVIVRHLVLPNNFENTKGVIDFLADFDRNIYVSLMAQYFPTKDVVNHPKLNRRLTVEEYEQACDYFFDAGLSNGYFQELSSNSEAYVPDFDLSLVDEILNKIK